MINIRENTNKVLNIIKAQQGLKDKSEAIDFVVNEYEQILLEPELRPEYKIKLKTIIKGKHLTRAQLENEVK
ncbi:MAG: antitoxin [Candidatus Woesearchaeota archaeon]